MKTHPLAILLLAGTVGTLGTACGSDLECGTGTVEQDGVCVPGESACAAGTTYSEGECVPDGSVICETGTVYDPGTGACVPDESACAEGTVLVNGQCVPEDDTLVADVTEPAEPNGLNEGDVPGEFTVPTEGDFVTLGGCITPFEDIDQNGQVDADFDAFVFTVTEPTLLDITVDGLHGLAGGFKVVSGDARLQADGWERRGVNLVGDTSARQVYLPAAGSYAIAVTDSRSLALDTAAGSESTCYFATVKTAPIPAASAYTDIVEGVLGAPSFYSFDPAEGDLVFPTVTAPGESASAEVTVLVNGEYRTSTPFVQGGEGQDASTAVAGLADADEVLIVVDAGVNYSLTDVAYSLEAFVPGVAAAPADGAALSIPNDGFNFLWLYFDVAAGDVMTYDYNVTNTGSAGTVVAVISSDFQLVSEPCPIGDIFNPNQPCTAHTGTIQFPEAGRYYFRVVDLTDPQPENLELTVTRSQVQPTAITLGTPVTAVALDDSGSDYYTVDASDAAWVSYFGNPTGFAGDMSVEFFDSSATGELGIDVFSEDAFTLDGATEVGRIYGDSGKTFLVKVSDSGAAADATYDFDVAERVFTEATVDEATPFDETATALAAGEANFYLVHAVSGTELTVTASAAAGSDLILTALDSQEAPLTGADATGDGGEETFSVTVGADGVVALRVEDKAGAAGTYDLSVTGVDPATYSGSKGTLPFTSICPGDAGGAGEILTTAPAGGDADDEGLSAPVTVDFGFRLFGDAVDEVTVSTNGWLTATSDYAGDAAFDNTPLPTAGSPDGVIAPFWTDMAGVSVCVLKEADTLTIEWHGSAFFGPGVAEVQAVLHDTGVIDLIYGPNQQFASDVATVGIENLAGTLGEEISFNTPGAGVAGTSYTLTPDP